MKIVNRYILQNFIRYLLICLIVLVFIYIVINLFDNLGKFLAKNVLVKDIIIYYVYLTPSYIVLLIPVASIMAIFFIFGMMTKNKELIALKTCGLNINTLFTLILTAGFIISICTFVFQETVGVWAQTKMFEHKEENIDHRPQRTLSRRRNFFYHGEGNWIYFIRRFNNEIKQMDGVIIWQITKENRIKKRIDAQYGIYKDNMWQFHSVTAREFDTLGQEAVSVHTDLAMPELREKPEDFLKRVKPLEEMNLLEIYQFVKKKTRAGEEIAKEKVELNYRFSYPVITIIVLLITLPLSVVLKRGGIAIGLGISIVLAFIYWGIIQSCRAYGVAGFIDPVLAAWLPNIIFGLTGIILILKVPR
jgi:lipopolysaccharide export system permease protein